MSIQRKCHQICKCLLPAFFVLVCSASGENSDSSKQQNTATQKTETAVRDTIPRVTGIGGIFFKCDSPKVVREWYGKNLGMETNNFGSMFVSRNFNNPDKLDRLQWTPFKSATHYFDPSKQEFMINYRVNDLGALIAKLRENGVTIVDTMETYDYGKFVHIMDPFGNKIELWEPIDSVKTKADEKAKK